MGGSFEMRPALGAIGLCAGGDGLIHAARGVGFGGLLGALGQCGSGG
jgi:hypothetical protein